MKKVNHQPLTQHLRQHWGVTLLGLTGVALVSMSTVTLAQENPFPAGATTPTTATTSATSAAPAAAPTGSAAPANPTAILGKRETAQSAALPTVAQPAEMDPKTNARLVEISRQLRCLVCQNESIADSSTEAAVELRRETAALIAEGKTNEEVIKTMVERYGDVVLYNPAFRANTFLLWVAPVAFFLLALWAMVKGGLWRRRETAGAEMSAERRAQVALAREMLAGHVPFDPVALKAAGLKDTTAAEVNVSGEEH